MIKLCTIIYESKYSTPKMSIVLHIFIKIRKFDCSFGVGTKICFLLTYILSNSQLSFSSKIKVPRLGSEPSQLFFSTLCLYPNQTYKLYLILEKSTLDYPVPGENDSTVTSHWHWSIHKSIDC